MAEATFTFPVTGTIHIDGDSLTIRVHEYMAIVKIQGTEAETQKRLQLEKGRTLFDLVLAAAITFVEETGDNEFSAADLYHIAFDKNPNLNLRRNSWGSHVVSSSPNHPSYRHYTSHRKYFRYHGRGRYSLDPTLLPEATGPGGG